MTVYVTSDTHFNHENILKFPGGRGCDFQSVKEMNECMIDNWNSIVKPGDKVYHLGDVFFGPKEDFRTLWPKLNGSKRLVVGNHDDIKYLSSGGFFKKVTMWRMFPEFNCVLTHVPIHDSGLFRLRIDRMLLNIHGHTHRNGSPEGPYKSVCVELTGYKPVALEELT
jgi:calcineurin-like phosphoesterase family protein